MNKRIKEISCILLVAVMLVCQYSYAIGEQATEPPVLMGINEELLGVWAKELGFSKPFKNLFITKSYDDYYDKVQDYRPDFFMFGGHETPKAWFNKGIIEPFTPTDAMLNEIASMPNYVQAAFRNELMTDEGQLLGYPASGYCICEFPHFIGYWIPDAWNASPFKSLTPPSSFEEMLDFMEIYLDTPHEGFCFYRGSGDNSKQKYLVDLFVDPLLESWIVQRRYAGEPIVFSDEKFIELIGRAQKLYQRMLKSDYQKNANQKKRYLFASRLLRGWSCNMKDTFTCANIIPLRVTADQPPLMNLGMGLLCVRSGSPYAPYAAKLFEASIPHMEQIRGMAVYDVWAFPDLFDLEAYNLDMAKAPKYQQYTRGWVESVKDLDQYITPCLEDGNYIIASQYSEFMQAEKRYFMECKMTAEEFAEELDREWAAVIHGASDKDIWIVEFPEDSD